MATTRKHALEPTEAARVFDLLGDECRLRLLLLLAERGEANVGELVRELGISQPAVSHHLRLLRWARLVEARRASGHVYYCIIAPIVRDLLDVACGR